MVTTHSSRCRPLLVHDVVASSQIDDERDASIINAYCNGNANPHCMQGLAPPLSRERLHLNASKSKRKIIGCCRLVVSGCALSSLRCLDVHATMMQAITSALSQNNTDAFWHISSASTLEQHQERLNLLHHARTCPHDETDDAACPVAPRCAEAKRQWKHIAICQYKDTCTLCYASRYVLTHYRNCKDGMCQICGPVREEIRRRKTQQQQQGQALQKTETFSTAVTPSTHPSSCTPVAGPKRHDARQAPLTVSPHTTSFENPMPTLTVAICRSADNVGKIIPVRRRSFSSLSDRSLSTLSQGSYSSSPPSSYAPSSAGSATGRPPRQYRTHLKPGQCRHPNCGGIKCRENLGIAHFYKETKNDIGEKRTCLSRDLLNIEE